MASPVRVILVGLGGMGTRHLGGFLALHRSGRREVELVGLCDQDAGRRTRAAQQARLVLGRQVREFEDLDEVLAADDVDAVDLAVPTHLHHPLVLRALAAGHHVLVEKPFALTMAQAAEMTAAARAAGTVLAVAENFRRVPPNRAFASWVAEGVLGDVYFTTSTLSLPARLLHPDGAGDWYRDRRLSGSLAALEMGVHEMDLLQFWFGPLREVHGLVRTFEPDVAASNGGALSATSDDSCFATVTTQSGVVAQLALTMAGHGEPVGRRLAVGSAGSATSSCWEAWQQGSLSIDGSTSVAVDDEVGRWVSAADPHLLARVLPEGTWDPTRLAVDVGDPVRYGIAAEVLDFARAVLGEGAVEVGPEQASHALAGALAILESSACGRSVLVDDVLDGTVSTWQDELEPPRNEASAPGPTDPFAPGTGATT
jgi:1,5-anhydro-D-fructose reductase (1,5-anhydro-D-mannitol-forming)